MEYFTAHPRSKGLTYLQHFEQSITVSVIFFLGSVQAGLHAVFPFIFETGSTDITKILTKKLKIKTEKNQ